MANVANQVQKVLEEAADKVEKARGEALKAVAEKLKGKVEPGMEDNLAAVMVAATVNAARAAAEAAAWTALMAGQDMRIAALSAMTVMTAEMEKLAENLVKDAEKVYGERTKAASVAHSRKENARDHRSILGITDPLPDEKWNFGYRSPSPRRKY